MEISHGAIFDKTSCTVVQGLCPNFRATLTLCHNPMGNPVCM